MVFLNTYCLVRNSHKEVVKEQLTTGKNEKVDSLHVSARNLYMEKAVGFLLSVGNY